VGIKEDRDEFNNTGIRGLLKKLMREVDEGFIRELPGGWHGEIVFEHPAPGAGPYLHYRRGFAVLRYTNVI
jgi:hypothetical protein